ncbi:hypothetical protein [Fructobacillus cardui]|jgi:hypothetical protein|uniref:hypothetical protein n=1 Tax=Fructobacillus cardui TaxID=2893170 RepID=UPI002596CDA2|nr:hypothetical protein [uncultured Fructobacillus sp.]CAK1222132.1 unnamed protein product [Fructobacillus cardui]
MNTGNPKNSLVVIGLLFKNLKLPVMLLVLISVMTLLRKGLETISISGVKIVIDNLDKAMFAINVISIVAIVLNILLLVLDWSEGPFDDYLQNIISSMEYTWHFRRYLKQRKNRTVLSIERPMQRTSIDDFNKIIKKSIIDYHENYILICMDG